MHKILDFRPESASLAGLLAPFYKQHQNQTKSEENNPKVFKSHRRLTGQQDGDDGVLFRFGRVPSCLISIVSLLLPSSDHLPCYASEYS